MNQIDMYKAMGEIDDIFLEQAESCKGRKKKQIPVYKIAAALAACLVLVTGITLLTHPQFSKENGTKEDGIATTPAIADENANDKTKADIPVEDGSDEIADMPELHFGEEINEMIAADVALPEGYFFADMTKDEIVDIWGGNAWWGEDYKVSGEIIYDGNGKVWIASVNGTSKDGNTEFNLQLSPEQLPAECMGRIVTENADNIWGTLVDGGQAHYDRDGDDVEEHIYNVVFLREEGESVGARFEVSSTEDETACTLMKTAVYSSLKPSEKSTLTISHLKPDTIPEWRSEKLTYKEALKEEGFAEYILTEIPQNYTFEGAWRELGQDRDYLYVSWYEDENYISINIQKKWEERPLADINSEKDYYDASKYKASDVPDTYWEDYASPIFAEKDVTEELLKKRIRWLEDAQYYDAEFSILYEDNTLVSYSVQAQEESKIWAVLEQLTAHYDTVSANTQRHYETSC